MIISFVTAKNYSMKLAVLLVILAVGMIPISAYADSEFVYMQLPGKLLEYTDGTIQVFVESGGLMVPQKITGLKTTSTDTSIVEIIGVEPANKYITNIQIQALKPGTANIILAAPGFMSQEIPIEVFNSNNFPTQIQMKITPNDFPVDGPRHGFIGIELLTTSGQPSKAEYDTLIKFSTPNTDMIKLKEKEVLIKKGEYFTLNEFNVLSSGEPIIFAETEGMKRISQFINIQGAAEPYRIQVYAHPSTFTSYSNPTAFLIIQLQDDDGVPVTAEKDVQISITTTNPDASINTSDDFKEVLFSDDTLKIEKGSYWATTSFTTRPDLGDFTESGFQDYTISVSTDDYISTSTSIRVIHERIGDGDSGQVKGGVLLGEGPAFFEVVPFLTTGKKELIGVLYLEATVPITDKLNYLAGTSIIQTISEEVTIPVMTKSDLELNIASSSLSTVNVINPIVTKGGNSALVFGNTGTVAPQDCEIEFYLTDNDGVSTIEGDPYGPVKDSLSLTVEPLIPKILAGTNFPIIGFLIEGSSSSDGSTCYSGSDENGRFGVTQFTEDTILTFSADEFLEIDSAVIKQNQPFMLMDVQSKKIGTSELQIRGTDLSAIFSLQSHTTDPTSFELTFPETTLPGTNALLAIQALDSGGNPVYAKEDIEVALVSNNESVLEIPDSLVILKNDYRTIFEIFTKAEGTSEIALLSEGLPLANFNLNVKGMAPVLNMQIAGTGLVGEPMTATLTVSYPGVSVSAEGMDVKWTISGAEVLHQRSVTDENGKAVVEIISYNPITASIKASVSGEGITTAQSAASYTFEHPEGYVEVAKSDNFGMGGLIIEDTQLFYIIVPAVIAGTFLFLKRTNRLEGITNRLPLDGLGEKFEDIKDRVSEIRERD